MKLTSIERQLLIDLLNQHISEETQKHSREGRPISFIERERDRFIELRKKLAK